MTSKHGLDGVSEAATYLLPKDSQSPRQSAVYRPSNKAQSAEEGREHVPSPRPAAAETPPPTLLEQGCAALFYAVASLLVIFVNKVRVRCGGSVLSRIDERTSEALTTFRCRVHTCCCGHRRSDVVVCPAVSYCCTYALLAVVRDICLSRHAHPVLQNIKIEE